MLIRNMSFPGTGFIIGLLFVASTMGTDKAIFTGTWVRNPILSDAFTAVVDARIKLPSNVHYEMTIRQDGKRLIIRVDQDGMQPETYLLNQWQRSIPLQFGSKGVRMKFIGSETLLVEKYSIMKGNYGDARNESTQEWVLSQGDKVLTIKTTDRESSTMVVTKEVFNRK